MKLLIASLLSLVLFQTNIQVLHWNPKRKHVWSDFRGSVASGSYRSAYSSVGFAINADLISDTLYFKCITCFNCTASWYKKSEATPDLLNHENLHFDISEAYARSLKKMVKETPLTKSDYKEKIDKMIQFMKSETASYQKLYDRETDYSLNQQQQQKWNHRIFTELLSLKNYSDTVVKIIIKK